MRHNYGAICQNVKLRPLEQGDIEWLRIWRNDDSQTRFLRRLDEITPQMQEKWFEKYLGNSAEIIFAIEEIEQLNRLVGSVALYNFNGDTAEIGRIQVGDPKAHGRGIGEKSFVMALLIGFQRLGLKKITASVHQENIAAHKTYIKIGFRITGHHAAPMGGIEDEIEIDENRLMEVNKYISKIVIIGPETGAYQTRELDELQKYYNQKQKELYGQYMREVKQLRQRYEAVYPYKELYEGVTNSLCWRITSPLRKLGDWFARHSSHNDDENTDNQEEQNNDFGQNSFSLPGEERSKKKQVRHDFRENIKFSLLVLLHDSFAPFTEAMIQSVQNQVYTNWELCIVEGGDVEGNPASEAICARYAEKDKRILYRKLEKVSKEMNCWNTGMELATGDYMALLDPDDLLAPEILLYIAAAIEKNHADLVYTDETMFQLMDSGERLLFPCYKPDYSPDTLRSYNYIGRFFCFSRSLREQTGNFNEQFDRSQEYDYILRLTEHADRIIHIPEALYYRRQHENADAEKIRERFRVDESAKRVLQAHLDRLGLAGRVDCSMLSGTYRISYKISGEPKISILIPNKDHVNDLRTCVSSVLEKSTYRNYEIIIVENNSELESTFAYYDFLQKNERVKIIRWEGGFNYSAINNFAEKSASGEYLLLLNNDVEVITPDWMEELLMFAQREDVGAVGAMLYYPDDTIQHAGVIMGLGGAAGHSHRNCNRDEIGYTGRLTVAQNLSGVTAACLLVKRKVFREVGGLDEEYAVDFNDVDFCMRIRKAGYLNVFTPYAELYHYESKSRGKADTGEKKQKLLKEVKHLAGRWQPDMKNGDPYYNKNLTLDEENFLPC